MSVRKRTWTTRRGEQREAYIVHYYDQDGHPHIRTFDRKKEADAHHDLVRTDVRKGLHIAPSKSATVAEAAENWLNQVRANGMRGRGPAERTTLRQYRQHVNLHIVPRLGKTKLAELTPKAVEDFQNDLLENLSRPLAKTAVMA